MQVFLTNHASEIFGQHYVRVAPIFKNIEASTKASLDEFRDFFMLTPDVDKLKLFIPHKADVIVRILNGIEALADIRTRGRLVFVGAETRNAVRYAANGIGFAE